MITLYTSAFDKTPVTSSQGSKAPDQTSTPLVAKSLSPSEERLR